MAQWQRPFPTAIVIASYKYKLPFCLGMYVCKSKVLVPKVVSGGPPGFHFGVTKFPSLNLKVVHEKKRLGTSVLREGRGFELSLAPLSFSKLYGKLQFIISFYSEEKYCNKTCIVPNRHSTHVKTTA